MSRKQILDIQQIKRPSPNITIILILKFQNFFDIKLAAELIVSNC